MTYNNYFKQIIAFNSDKDIITLREKFNKPSFFEIISKERSETTYSSFLKWLLQENCLDEEACTPLSLLLDVLVRRSEEQKDQINSILSDECIKRSIVTRNLNIKSVKVETEKLVSSLVEDILAKPYSTFYVSYLGRLPDDDLRKIAAKSRDRIDLFVDCEVESESFSAKHLQIIIENKIDSVEGGKKQSKVTGVKDYDDASQTERYYLATKFSTVDSGKVYDGRDTLQLYVYLTPQVPKPDACTDKHFIQISYQDIVDCILIPMLASSSLSVRSRFFLEEFLNQLVFPSLDGTTMHPSIASSEQYAEEFSQIWIKYQPLLTNAAIAASETNLWKIDDTYYDHQPRKELLELLLDKGIQDDIIVNGEWKQNTRYSKMQELAEYNGIKVEMSNLCLDDNTQELLSSFWEKNKRLLTAIIKGMNADERKKTEALLTQLSKRDTTKYSAYYNNRLIGTNLGKAQTAFCIVKLWAERQKADGKDVTLEILNKTIPRAYNPYYENGKWFKDLFYEVGATPMYDGEKADGPVQGNWDFDTKGRFNIETTDGKKVTMLKMWRKDGLEHLIEEVTKRKLFKGTLDIVPIS